MIMHSQIAQHPLPRPKYLFNQASLGLLSDETVNEMTEFLVLSQDTVTLNDR